MRIGLLGAGRMGTFHAATLAEHPEVEHLVVADTAQDRAAALGERFRVELAPDPYDVLEAGVDAVIVAATTAIHPVLVGAALDARIPIFCEKPIALELTETAALVDRAAEREVPLTVGFQRRCDESYLKLRRSAQGGGVGRLYLVRVVAGDPAPPPAGYLPGSGGMFRDQIIHDFDAVRWVTGSEVEEVYAVGDALTGDPQFAACGDVDTVVVVLKLTGGVLATVTGSRHNAGDYDSRMEVAGSGGVAVAGSVPDTPAGAQGGPNGASGSASPVRHPSFLDRFADAYRAEIRQFIDFVAGRADNPCGGHDALVALRIAAAADRSREQGRSVRVAEVAP